MSKQTCAYGRSALISGLAFAGLVFLPLQACADRTVSGTISGTESWNEGEVVTVTSSVTVTGDLSIARNVRVKMAPGSTFSVSGGGSLRVSGEAGQEVVFTSGAAVPDCGDWVGLRWESTAAPDTSFMTYATVEHARTGLSIDSVSPVFRFCTIREICTPDGADGTSGASSTPGASAEPAFGVVITGPCSPTVEECTVTTVSAGWGGDGGSGANGAAGTNGTSGQAGGTGGNGTAGAAAGSGGVATGIRVTSGATPVLRRNLVNAIRGGNGGRGGQGGHGGAGGTGAPGAMGGAAGHGAAGGAGAAGGHAYGLFLSGPGAAILVQQNRVVDVYAGIAGPGGNGGNGGTGGRGGNGANNLSGVAQSGGDGARGGDAGTGGGSGPGSNAAGIYLENATPSNPFSRNEVRGVRGGDAAPNGTGGSGGEGGAGGNGGFGASRGGNGGDGGPGGNAGGAGRPKSGSFPEGVNAGIVANNATLEVQNNLICYIVAADGATAGAAGQAGRGGAGGDGGSGGITGVGGCGGSGGNGANGAKGIYCGSTYGIHTTGVNQFLTVVHSTLAEIGPGKNHGDSTWGSGGGSPGANGTPDPGTTCGTTGSNGASSEDAGAGPSERAVVILGGSGDVRNCVITDSVLGTPFFASALYISGYGTLSASNNISWGWIWLYHISLGANNVQADPLYVNPGSGDFHLTSSSPAINHAPPGSVAVDLEGYPRPPQPDAGCYEFPTGLSVAKSPDTNPVIAGTTQTWTLVVHNQSTTPASDVTVTDSLPSGLTLVGANYPSSVSGNVVTSLLGTLDAFGSATLRLETFAASSITSGSTLANNATVDSAVSDNYPADNDSTATAAVNARADLRITKSDSLDPVMQAQEIVYTIRVENTGPSDALDVTITDTLPRGLTFVSSDPAGGAVTESGGVVTFDIGTVVAGSSVETRVTAAADPPSLLNTASVSSSVHDAAPENNSITEETALLSSPPADTAGPFVGAPVDAGDVTSNTTVTFTWPAGTDPDGVASYEIQVGSAPGHPDVAAGGAGASLSYTTSNTTDGQRLWARVRGRDTLGHIGPWSADSDGITVDLRPPTSRAVSGLGSVEASETAFYVVYEADDPTSGTFSAGVQGVELWYRYGTSGSFLRYGDLHDGGSIRFDTSGTGGKGIYQFYTRAHDRAGHAEDVPSTLPDLTVYYNGQVYNQVPQWTLYE